MEKPQSADLNKLKNILDNAKNIMGKVETGDYSSGNIDENKFNNDTSNLVSGAELHGQVPQPQMPQQSNTNDLTYNKPTADMIKNSKLPDEIKKAMLKSPTSQPNLYGSKFSAEDILGENVNKKTIQNKPQPKNINQNKPQPKISTKQIQEIVRKEMKSMVHEEIVSFFTKYFAKTLIEDSQKRLIKRLVNEGKIKVNK